MNTKYPIATICCSTRYKTEILKLYNELTEQGYIVLADLTDHEKQNEFEKNMIDNMHRQKIDMASVVYFLVKDNHMGKSVKEEFLYVTENNKPYKIKEITC